jgi:hypothetical protein
MLYYEICVHNDDDNNNNNNNNVSVLAVAFYMLQKH